MHNHTRVQRGVGITSEAMHRGVCLRTDSDTLSHTLSLTHSLFFFLSITSGAMYRSVPVTPVI